MQVSVYLPDLGLDVGPVWIPLCMPERYQMKAGLMANWSR